MSYLKRVVQGVVVIAAFSFWLFAVSDVWAGTSSQNAVTRGNFLRVPQYETTAAMNLFVNASTGSDSNPCTSSGSACATLQHAQDLIPKLVRHPVTVTVATGNYTGLLTTGFSFAPVSIANGAYISWTGTLITATLGSGTATGTATGGSQSAGSGPTFGTLGDSSQSWTVNALKGLLITTSLGQTKVIDSNTATVITIVGTWTIPVAASTTYTIQDWGSVTTTAINRPAVPNNAAGSNQGLYAEDNGSLREVAGTTTTQPGMPIMFTNMSFTPTTSGANGARLSGPNAIGFSRCKLVGNTGGTGLVPLYNTSVNVGESYIFSTLGGLNGGFNNAAGSLLMISATLIETSTNGAMIGNFNASISNCSFKTSGGFCYSMGQGGATTGSSGNVSITNSQCACSSTAGEGFTILGASGTGGYLNLGGSSVGGVIITGCGTAVHAEGTARVILSSTTNVFTGASTGTGLFSEKGGQILITANPTVSAYTNEVTVDSTNSTLAALLALTPPSIFNISYGSAVSK